MKFTIHTMIHEVNGSHCMSWAWTFAAASACWIWSGGLTYISQTGLKCQCQQNWTSLTSLLASHPAAAFDFSTQFERHRGDTEE